MLALKAEYKAATGQEWKPSQGGGAKSEGGANTHQARSEAPAGADMAESAGAVELKAKIDAQGNKVKELKAAKASKVELLYV